MGKSIKNILKRDGFKVVPFENRESNPIEALRVKGEDFYVTLADVSDSMMDAGFKLVKPGKKRAILKDRDTIIHLTDSHKSGYPVAINRYHSGNNMSMLNVASAQLGKFAHVAERIAKEEEDESFVQKLMGIRKNFRGLVRNRMKMLKKLGITKPIRPTIRIEELIDLLADFTVPVKTGAATVPDKSDFFKGLMTLKNKRKKRLKNFGWVKPIRPTMKLQELLLDVVMPITQMSIKEEKEAVEQEDAKIETGQVDTGQDMIPPGGFLEPIEKSLPEDATQPVESEEELFSQAEDAQEEMLNWLDRGKGIDKKLGLRNVPYDMDEIKKPGPILLAAPLKSKERSREKVMADYDGDWSKLTDVVRASIAVDSVDQISGVMDELRKSGMELAKKPKDRFANPTTVGYRDLLMNVKYPSGHIGELQVHLKPILIAKDEGHTFYEDVREVEATAKMEKRNILTPEEQAIVDEANNKMAKKYEEAWRKGIGRVAGAFNNNSKKSRYFKYDGNPARVTQRGVPSILTGKKFKTLYDFEKFYREAEPVTARKYLRMLTKRKRIK